MAFAIFGHDLIISPKVARVVRCVIQCGSIEADRQLFAGDERRVHHDLCVRRTDEAHCKNDGGSGKCFIHIRSPRSVRPSLPGAASSCRPPISVSSGAAQSWRRAAQLGDRRRRRASRSADMLGTFGATAPVTYGSFCRAAAAQPGGRARRRGRPAAHMASVMRARSGRHVAQIMAAEKGG